MHSAASGFASPPPPELRTFLNHARHRKRKSREKLSKQGLSKDRLQSEAGDGGCNLGSGSEIYGRVRLGILIIQWDRGEEEEGGRGRREAEPGTHEEGRPASLARHSQPSEVIFRKSSENDILHSFRT